MKKEKPEDNFKEPEVAKARKLPPNVYSAHVIATNPNMPGILVQQIASVEGERLIRMIDLRNGQGFSLSRPAVTALIQLLAEWEMVQEGWRGDGFALATRKERGMSKCLRCGAGSEWIQGNPPRQEADARISELERLLEETVEALIWCSGSADFGEGGKAEEGWKKLCEPFIRRALKGKP